METYKSEYTNEYGENWVFEYNYSTNVGLVRGSDVDWNTYAVIEGQAHDLVLNQSEKNWLKSTWSDATKHLNNVGMYLGLDTKFEHNEHKCWLTNSHCPICLKQKRDFEYHHCIWSMDGGSDDYFNMLRICNTCHAILTRGSVEDRVPKDQAVYYHQIM